ncbi:glycosyl hydrolase family 8 [Rufibacter latericius]|uniref:glycosyl hydrolase family 8 n=1 Tax=Rufibacter latericius TaxID=2487040 RepID=UPI001D039F0E|nr:glycosyl hydrolase family 8 [Rufibacter latericius]
MCSCFPQGSTSSEGVQKTESGPEKGAFTTKKYRNLFKENGHSAEAIKEKINLAYEQLFRGDSATQAIYFQAGTNDHGPMAYIYDVYNKDVRSEGMSYGMMIAVQMNQKAEFDALWNYALTHMYLDEPGHPSEGYFAWSVKPDGTKNSEGPAPDGEEYFAMALYFASGRWGNGEGFYNYKSWADKILFAIRHNPERTGTTQFGTQTSGSMVNEEMKMILFVPTNQGRKFTDPSYHLPAFYDLWALWGPEPDREFWKDAAQVSRDFFQKTTHPVTGLAPDYAHFDGSPVTTPFNPNSHRFAYDSWRTAMNWSVDWAWWQKDPREVQLSNKIQAFFASQGLSSYGSIYSLDGQKVSPGPPAGLVATNAVASLAASHPLAKDFTEALWNLPVPHTVGDRYYGGLLYLMSFLHCSGQFKIYYPR